MLLNLKLVSVSYWTAPMVAVVVVVDIAVAVVDVVVVEIEVVLLVAVVVIVVVLGLVSSWEAGFLNQWISVNIEFYFRNAAPFLYFSMTTIGHGFEIRYE